MYRFKRQNRNHRSENYPWDKTSKLGKDYSTRAEYMGFFVSRSGLIFDGVGNYIKPTFRYNSKGEVTVRRLRFYQEGKQLEYGYDRFVYAAWNQDSFDIDNKDMVVYRSTYTNSGHVEHLSVTTRDKMLEKAVDKVRYIPKEHHKEIIETWEQVKDVITKEQMANQLGLPVDAFERIVENE